MWNEDYKDMLSSLQSEGVEFLLIGAFAMAAHGFPRATGDIDLWVFPSSENSEKVLRALSRFGAPISQIRREDFEHDDTVFQIGVPPRRIDLLTGITGVSFAQARDSGVEMTIDGIPLKVISVELLIANKRATGRPRDLDDAQHLETLLK